jgi:hypothetical protein
MNPAVRHATPRCPSAGDPVGKLKFDDACQTYFPRDSGNTKCKCSSNVSRLGWNLVIICRFAETCMLMTTCEQANYEQIATAIGMEVRHIAKHARNLARYDLVAVY